MNQTMKLTDIPVMSIQYSEKGLVNTTEVQASNAYWKYKSADGIISSITIGNIRHPMDMVSQLSKIEIPDKLHAIKIDFSSAPGSFTVRYWPEQYSGFREAYEIMYENLKINGKSVILPHEDHGYVCQVHAMWPQGNANYEFYLVNCLTNN